MSPMLGAMLGHPMTLIWFLDFAYILVLILLVHLAKEARQAFLEEQLEAGKNQSAPHWSLRLFHIIFAQFFSCKKGEQSLSLQVIDSYFLLKRLVPCNTRYVLKISLAICTFPTTAPKSMSAKLGSWNNEGLRGLFFLCVFIHSSWYCSNAAGSLFSCRLETLFCLSHCINSGVKRSWLVIGCCFLKDVPPFPSWS